jgi:hypothetical protein
MNKFENIVLVDPNQIEQLPSKKQEIGASQISLLVLAAAFLYTTFRVRKDKELPLREERENVSINKYYLDLMSISNKEEKKIIIEKLGILDTEEKRLRFLQYKLTEARIKKAENDSAKYYSGRLD